MEQVKMVIAVKQADTVAKSAMAVVNDFENWLVANGVDCGNDGVAVLMGRLKQDVIKYTELRGEK